MNLQERPQAAILPQAMIKSHAYILWGGNDAERAAASLQLAAAVLCAGAEVRPCGTCVHCVKAFRGIHPDIAVLERLPDKRDIIVEQIRDLREDAVLLPNEAEKKVYIIRRADIMNIPAQNAILKLLEEPPAPVTLILEAETPSSLLATVRSRCVELRAATPDGTSRVAAAPDDDVAAMAGAYCRALSDRPVALVSFSFRLEKLDRSKFTDFIAASKDILTGWLREGCPSGEKPLSRDSLLEAVALLDRAGDYFDANVGLGHIAGMLCAGLSAAEAT